jgi:ATP-dependent DNA helicase RecG
MNPALEKLAKFLRLEAQRGFDDRAVFGGLGRALEPWQSEARAAGLPEPVVEAVVARLRDYASLSPASRWQALHGLAERLADEFPEFSDAVPPPAAPGDGGERSAALPDSIS